MQETYQIRDEIASAKWRASGMLNFCNFDAALKNFQVSLTLEPVD